MKNAESCPDQTHAIYIQIVQPTPLVKKLNLASGCVTRPVYLAVHIYRQILHSQSGTTQAVVLSAFLFRLVLPFKILKTHTTHNRYSGVLSGLSSYQIRKLD